MRDARILHLVSTTLLVLASFCVCVCVCVSQGSAFVLPHHLNWQRIRGLLDKEEPQYLLVLTD